MLYKSLCRPQISLLSRGMTAQCSTSAGDSKKLGPNDTVSPTFRNRNPMNLEKMRIAPKPEGFEGDLGKRNFWNGLNLSISANHTSASVTHWTGRKVCSASTKEWPIQKFLYSNSDLAAVKIVGKVLGEFRIFPLLKLFTNFENNFRTKMSRDWCYRSLLIDRR